MSDQSEKGTASQGEATRPVNSEASGSGGNSSTQNQSASTYTPTASGGGEGNTQETSGQPFTLKRYLKEPPLAGHFNDAAAAAAGGRPEVPKEGQRAQAELEISDDEEKEDQPADKGGNKNVK